MKSSAADAPPAARSPGRRLLLLAPVGVLAGIVLAGLWFKYGGPTPGFLWPGGGSAGLSGETRDRLRRLDSPVELRFYAVLPPESAPAPLPEFSRRVDRLLSEFQSANDAQIHVVRSLSNSETNARAAAADGLQPFNLEKGGACFLGLAVVSGERKEILARLQPEWEAALPFDLARAILQVTAAAAPVVARSNTADFSAATNEIKRLIPDLAGTSLADGARILREAALQELAGTGAEMEQKLQAAQQQLANAQSGGSEAEQQEALKLVQQVQLEQGERYKQIATRLQAQITVFEQMKAAAAPAK